MLEPLIIDATDDTPKVVFDKENNIFELSGLSLPEDTTSFYSPLQEWIETYVEKPNDFTTFTLNLKYFNSSSANRIVKLLIALESIEDKENKVKVVWLYDSKDEVMMETGENIKNVIELPCELKSY